MKIPYALRVLSGAKFKNLNKVIDSIHEKTGKSKIYLFYDIAKCAILYGAGYNDYDIFEFYNIKHNKRKTFVTRFKNKKMLNMLNDPAFSDLFDKKSQFNERFKKYLGRDFVNMHTCTLDEFKKFVKGKEYIFAKPDDGDSGKGIERLKVKDYKKIDDLYNYVKDKNFGVCEEQAIQHKDMARMHPDSINCVRIQTIVTNGKPEVVYAAFKAGNGGHFVDNLGFDGINIPVDLKTHKLVKYGRTEHRQIYTEHPYTHIKFEGYKLPLFKEAMDMCLKAALEVPEVKFVGWDVYIGPKGPGIIEGNNFPDYYFWQLPIHNPDRIGLLPWYKKRLPKL